MKGLHAIVEIIAGSTILVTQKENLVSFVTFLIHNEVAEDRNEFFAHYLINLVSSLSLSSQQFISLYLLSHGVIKGILVILLFKKKVFAYPTAIFIFSLFIFYQLYRYTNTHSLWLLVLSLFDSIVIALTLHEYNILKRKL